MSRCINKFRKIIYNRFYHEALMSEYQSRLKNKDFSILANNCIGGVLYHDLGQRFLSPTINLYFVFDEYLEFLENLDYYLNCELEESGKTEDGSPIGCLNGKVRIFGLHYDNFPQLKEKWEQRSKRIDVENLFVIGCYIDGCNDTLAKRFCELAYKNKVLLSPKKLPFGDCVAVVKSRKKAMQIPGADKMASCKTRAYYQAFDFVTWLNNKKI